MGGKRRNKDGISVIIDSMAIAFSDFEEVANSSSGENNDIS
jgi:hypothetical protein